MWACLGLSRVIENGGGLRVHAQLCFLVVINQPCMWKEATVKTTQWFKCMTWGSYKHTYVHTYRLQFVHSKRNGLCYHGNVCFLQDSSCHRHPSHTFTQCSIDELWSNVAQGVSAPRLIDKPKCSICAYTKQHNRLCIFAAMYVRTYVRTYHRNRSWSQNAVTARKVVLICTQPVRSRTIIV